METRFSTYASYWIKQSIKRALVNTAKTIRIPPTWSTAGQMAACDGEVAEE